MLSFRCQHDLGLIIFLSFSFNSLLQILFSEKEDPPFVKRVLSPSSLNSAGALVKVGMQFGESGNAVRLFWCLLITSDS